MCGTTYSSLQFSNCRRLNTRIELASLYTVPLSAVNGLNHLTISLRRVKEQAGPIQFENFWFGQSLSNRIESRSFAGPYLGDCGKWIVVRNGRGIGRGTAEVEEEGEKRRPGNWKRRLLKFCNVYTRGVATERQTETFQPRSLHIVVRLPLANRICTFHIDIANW